jgi:hypothetical protein
VWDGFWARAGTLARVDHRALLDEALQLEAEGQRALLEGDAQGARDALRAASDRYRASWEAAPPDAYGRLVGMLKAAVLAGDAETAARYVHTAVGDEPASPTSAYALAIAALVHGADELAARAAQAMRGGSDAFDRTADAIVALAGRDRPGYEAAVGAIVDDFAGRAEHLTGVPIADTALMLERLAGERGVAAQITSPLLPPA